jgi:hypothetical protein
MNDEQNENVKFSSMTCLCAIQSKSNDWRDNSSINEMFAIERANNEDVSEAMMADRSISLVDVRSNGRRVRRERCTCRKIENHFVVSFDLHDDETLLQQQLVRQRKQINNDFDLLDVRTSTIEVNIEHVSSVNMMFAAVERTLLIRLAAK